MRSRLLPFGTLMVTSLNTGLTFAHLLEMPAKRRFDASGYLRTRQIYRTFGLLGGLMEPEPWWRQACSRTRSADTLDPFSWRSSVRACFSRPIPRATARAERRALPSSTSER